MISKYGQLCPVTYGPGAITTLGESCAQSGVKKALIVIDPNVEKRGFGDKAADSLKKANIEYKFYNEVEMDAPDYSVQKGADLAKEMGADTVIGIGGGSTLDTAKGVALVACGNDLETLLNNPPAPNKALTIVMVPTTSGTGSESTMIAVITNTKTHYKTGLLAFPNISIVDPELTLDINEEITRYTALDAFSHASESLSSALVPNPHSDLLAYDAMERIVKYLPIALKEKDNLEARENLAIASNFAGKAFADSTVHIGHAMAHAMGATYHIPHGIGCALATPVVIEFMAPGYAEKCKKVGEILGVKIYSDDPVVIGKKVATAFREFMKYVGVPTWEELGHTKEEIMKCCDYVKKEAMANFGIIKPAEGDVERLMAEVCELYK
ncbi:Alcohol dehydrogenase, class IV [Acetitomaculum ruminis DSM 5522]|uniref:Alcohol dehydrogenase, class IV n=1 Tax=Acetitomaculum ruminis DSM 5522 TaxID=1120918 RepID=A0A1I0YI63_9FIRM|nr:iron-containing alcohol dehydrogenase [Acetitomaculum ruminis]SFB12446.1 Alcohol dehydrogenase, class IV [Acetitomaculum ruminis DSM 5522]